MTLRALNHVLIVICQINLRHFLPEEPLGANGRASLEGQTLKPVAERHILTTAPRLKWVTRLSFELDHEGNLQYLNTG